MVLTNKFKKVGCLKELCARIFQVFYKKHFFTEGTPKFGLATPLMLLTFCRYYAKVRS